MTRSNHNLRRGMIASLIVSLCLIIGSSAVDLLLILRAQRILERTDISSSERQALFLHAAQEQSRVAHLTRWTLQAGLLIALLLALAGFIVSRTRRRAELPN